MKIQLYPHQVYFIIALVISLNLFMIAGTGFFHFYYFEMINGIWEVGSKIKYVLLEFTLGTENTFATWYSSMLFLLVGLVSFLCYHVQKKCAVNEKDNFLSYGWIIFCLIFTLLSFDEIASMHERLGNLHFLNPVGDEPPGWVLLLAVPIGAVALFMLAFSWVHLRAVPLAAIFAFVAILLFLSVPFQEYIEVYNWQAAPDPDTYERPRLQLILEESAEIFGATSMLICTVLYAGQSGKRRQDSILRPLVNAHFRIRPKADIPVLILFFCLLAFPMVLMDQSRLLAAEGDIGVIGNWFPAAAAFLTSLISFYVFFQRKGKSAHQRYDPLFCGIFSLSVSAYFGGNFYFYFWYPETVWLKILFILFIVSIITVLTARQLKTHKNVHERTGIILWAVLSVIALSMHNAWSPYIAYFAFSALFVSFISRLN